MDGNILALASFQVKCLHLDSVNKHFEKGSSRHRWLSINLQQLIIKIMAIPPPAFCIIIVNNNLGVVLSGSPPTQALKDEAG